MATKEERLGLLKFAICECGDDRMSLIVKDNIVTDMATTNGKSVLHQVGYRIAPWVKW